MDWISFVGNHPGNPRISKMRSHKLDGGVLAQISKESALEAGILGRWLKETNENIEMKLIAKNERIKNLLAAIE